MTLSSQAAAVESENENLRTENRTLHETVILKDFELSQLRARCAKLETENDEIKKTASEWRSIVEHAASGMVSGMHRINQRGAQNKDTTLDAEFTEAPLRLNGGNGRDHSETFQ